MEGANNIGERRLIELSNQPLEQGSSSCYYLKPSRPGLRARPESE